MLPASELTLAASATVADAASIRADASSVSHGALRYIFASKYFTSSGDGERQSNLFRGLVDAICGPPTIIAQRLAKGIEVGGR
jgi:hypothetical protein